jgi:Nitroreductase family
MLPRSTTTRGELRVRIHSENGRGDQRKAEQRNQKDHGRPPHAAYCTPKCNLPALGFQCPSRQPAHELRGRSLSGSGRSGWSVDSCASPRTEARYDSGVPPPGDCGWVNILGGIMATETSQESPASQNGASIEAFFHVLRRRRSIRTGFLKDKPVPDELIQQVLEAGRWAPSAGNSQPSGSNFRDRRFHGSDLPQADLGRLSFQCRLCTSRVIRSELPNESYAPASPSHRRVVGILRSTSSSTTLTVSIEKPRSGR